MVQLGIYRHYKGNLYRVIGIANHSETLEEMVVYQPLYGEQKLWVRPLHMWDNVIDGAGVKRFELVSENGEAL